MTALTEEQLAAILGVLVLHTEDSLISIPTEWLAEGLPPDAGLRTQWNEDTEALDIFVVQNGQ